MNTERREFLNKPCSCSGENPNCHKCGGWGYIDDIGKGRAPVGPAGLPNKAIVRKGKSRSKQTHYKRDLSQCSECGQLVKRLSRHKRKVHGIATSYSQVAARPGLLKCPYCSSQVRQDRLDSHISLQHPHYKQKLKLDRSLTKKPSWNLAVTQIAPSKIIESKLDATRQYAHAFPEHGRFGSHPSHDDFSDEGEP